MREILTNTRQVQATPGVDIALIVALGKLEAKLEAPVILGGATASVADKKRDAYHDWREPET
jgi:hypothetical protein